MYLKMHDCVSPFSVFFRDELFFTCSLKCVHPRVLVHSCLVSLWSVGLQWVQYGANIVTKLSVVTALCVCYLDECICKMYVRELGSV